MHILQYVAVLAEDERNAIQTAQNHLEGVEYGRWFDWCNADDGRWADTDKPISHLTQTEAFVEKLAWLMNGRAAEVDHLWRKAKDTGYEFSDLVGFYDPMKPFSRDEEMALYGYDQIVKLLYGRWTWNSYFYDIENETTEFGSLQRVVNECSEPKADENGLSWWLVPVDFHF